MNKPSDFRKSFQLFRWIVGIGILACLIYFVDPRSLWKSLKEAHWEYIPLWISVALVGQVLGAFNIYILIRPFANVKFRKIFYYDIVASAVGTFTPMQIGRVVSLAVFLKKDSVRLYQSASVAIVDKLISLCVTISFAVLGVVFLYIELFRQDIHLLGELSLLWIIPTLLLRTEDSLYLRSRRLIREQFSGVAQSTAMYINHRKYLAMSCISTILVQLLGAFQLMIAFAAIGQAVSYFEMVFTLPFLSIVGNLPITIGGLGVQELVAIHIWKGLSIAPDKVLSAFLFSRMLFYSSAVFILVLNAGLKKKIEILLKASS